MEVAMEVIEDDVFFADLSQRISLLIMDDDEVPISHCPPVSFQALSQAVHNPTTHLPAYYEQNCRRETKGTGVFIPRSTQPRRKNKHARFNSSNSTRFHKHSDNSSRPQHHHEVTFNNNAINTISYNSFNHKRC